MGVIYRIDMTGLQVKSEEAAGDYAELGGRGLTSAVVAGEVPPDCHPLGADNKLVIAPGLLTGTGAPCSARLSAGAKSPLTGTIKESNAGGTAALNLARLGIKALIIEGQPEAGKTYRLVVSADGVKIEEAVALAGLGNYAVADALRGEFGEKVTVMSIGQAGEMRAGAASIAVTDMEGRPTRHCGRGGLGAVMGSKGLKAIVIDPAGGSAVKPADADAFKGGARKFIESLRGHPVTGTGLPTFGTNVLANIVNEAGAYPTRNFSEGQFEGVDAVSGETQHDVILERGGQIAHSCSPGCAIKCSRIYPDKDGNYLTKGPEYETVWAHGPNCAIDDLDAIAVMDRMDDDLGLDTIEMGATVAVAMEAGIIEFGDAQGAIGLLKEVEQGTPLGHLVAAGAEVLGKAYGVVRIPTVKGQAMPAYDPRAAQGIGVTYATSTMGADHTAGYAITANILGVGGNVDPLKPEGQVELSRGLQIATAAIDSLGLCLFVAFAVLDDENAGAAICEITGGLLGSPFSGDDFSALGRRVLLIEREFNKAAGFTDADDRLPAYFKTEKLPPHQVTFAVTDEDLSDVFNFTE